jgi:hypothetical protein
VATPTATNIPSSSSGSSSRAHPTPAAPPPPMHESARKCTVFTKNTRFPLPIFTHSRRRKSNPNLGNLPAPTTPPPNFTASRIENPEASSQKPVAAHSDPIQPPHAKPRHSAPNHATPRSLQNKPTCQNRSPSLPNNHSRSRSENSETRIEKSLPISPRATKTNTAPQFPRAGAKRTHPFASCLPFSLLASHFSLLHQVSSSSRRRRPLLAPRVVSPRATKTNTAPQKPTPRHNFARPCKTNPKRLAGPKACRSSLSKYHGPQPPIFTKPPPAPSTPATPVPPPSPRDASTNAR